jgi:hypothetical protein
MKKLALLLALLTTGACSSDDGPRSKMCQEACSAAADCVTTGTTVDDWICQSSRCVYNMCSNDDDCTDGYSCEDSLCVAPDCTDDNDCVAPTPRFTHCNSSGMCGCVDDSECAGAQTLCTSLGVCGCVDDTECTQSTRDKCYDGLCGCSSVDVCTGNTQGANTTWVCEKS